VEVELKAVVTRGGVVLNATPGAWQAITGTADELLGRRWLIQASGVNNGAAKGPDEVAAGLNTMIAAMKGLHPKDETEGMLAVQIVSTHSLGMFYLNAARADEANADKYLKRSDKLMTTMRRAMETLKAYRGKDPQHILVQHVEVRDGGQAAISMGNPALDAPKPAAAVSGVSPRALPPGQSLN
jgi:hypothetical protein